jgi:hypothetical protein
MEQVLQRHWQGEENGIFQAMAAREAQYAGYVAPLVVEHRELAELLATVDLSDPADQQRLRVAFELLAEHISKGGGRPLPCRRGHYGWCRVGRIGGGLVRGTSGREDDPGLYGGSLSSRGGTVLRLAGVAAHSLGWRDAVWPAGWPPRSQ